MTDYQVILTPRELHILNLLAEEFTNKEICNHFDISIETVESHRKNIFSKLSAKSILDAMHKAYQFGILKVQH